MSSYILESGANTVSKSIKRGGKYASLKLWKDTTKNTLYSVTFIYKHFITQMSMVVIYAVKHY